MNLFYADSSDIQSQHIILRGQEAEHVTKVLRHSVGDELFVTDGEGTCFTCTIRDFKKSMVFLDVIDERKENEYIPHVTLCLGLIKKRDRLEFAVEKAVELGASEIVLFRGERSQKGNVREDRLKTTAISAMKQSLRLYLPDIVVEDTLEAALTNHASNSSIIIADETKEGVSEEVRGSDRFFVVVGPEGGFSEQERKHLNTIQPVYYSLGKKRLRAETAAMVMVDRFNNIK